MYIYKYIYLSVRLSLCLPKAACRKKIGKNKRSSSRRDKPGNIISLVATCMDSSERQFIFPLPAFPLPRLSAGVARTRGKTNLLSLLGQGEASEYLPPLLEKRWERR